MISTDLTHKKFHDLTAIKRTGTNKFGIVMWEFLCDCGKTKILPGHRVKNGYVKSCGCRTVVHPFVNGESASARKKRLDRDKTEKWRGKSLKNRYEKHLKAKYNITLEKYEEMLALQRGLCAICRHPEIAKAKDGKTIKRLSVDHNHATGEIRGLLCDNCNKAVGCMQDDILRLQSAINYLESHS